MSAEALARALNELNAMGALEDLCKRDRFTWGPKAIKRRAPLTMGAVVWKRGSGYHGYKVLTLIGVWALPGDEDDDPVQIVVGVKHLAFAAPFFDAEAYHALIKRDFKTYYNDDSAPPIPENYRASFAFDADRRLEQRKALVAALRACV